MNVPIVELLDVSMYFPQSDGKPVQACHQLNLKIHTGELVTIVGESGCGKSTIGKIALGVQEPSQGHVLFEGRDIWADGIDSRLRRQVQVIHQDSFSSLNPVRTVFETLLVPINHGKNIWDGPTCWKLVYELLESVGLTPPEQFMAKYPFQLSGGQRQRVSIARATVLEPALIIADEPVSAVDASLRLTILDLMQALCRTRGIAFLYITHDLATARYFAARGRLIVMYLGRMVETGIVEKSIKNPGHPYLRALLSAIPSPSPDRNWNVADLPLKSFEMPSPKDPPPGCVFHPRCPHSTPECETLVPILEPITDQKDHQVACHHRHKLDNA